MRASEKQARTAADYAGWAERDQLERERELNWDRPPYDELRRPAACFSERRPTPRERAAIRPRARSDEIRRRSGTIGRERSPSRPPVRAR